MNQDRNSQFAVVLSVLLLSAMALTDAYADNKDEQTVEVLLLQRFDINMDTQLDGNEKAAARERLRHLLEDRTGFPLHIEDITDARIADLLKVFDGDANGQLNAEEQKRFQHLVERLLADHRDLHDQPGHDEDGKSTERRRPPSRQETRRRIQEQRRRQANGDASGNRATGGDFSTAGSGGFGSSGADSFDGGSGGGDSPPVGAG